MNSRTLLCLSALSATSLGVLQARATEILPSSYSFVETTDLGTYDYADETHNQLIDGHYGVAPWTTDLGNGPAYEWLGWTDRVINLDFTFSGAHNFSEIRVGTVQDYLQDVVMPDVAVYVPDGLGGWTFVKSVITPESNANNDLYKTIVLDNLGITASSVRVTLTHNLDGPWTFTDEVDFFGTATNTPDTGSTLMLGGVAAIGLGLMRRRNQASQTASLALIPVSRRR